MELLTQRSRSREGPDLMRPPRGVAGTESPFGIETECARPRAQRRGKSNRVGLFRAHGNPRRCSGRDGRTPGKPLGERRFFSIGIRSLPVLLLLVSSFAAPVHGQAFKEYDLKAAFLYRLAQFVEWPPAAFPAADAPLVIGVLGADPFGKVLDEIVQNEAVKNRKLVVQRYRRVEEINLCHILFVSPPAGERQDQILSRLKGRNILTVGETEGFAQQGGIVRFLTEKNKVRLRINVDAAKAANLTISSKLLRAAELVGVSGTSP